MGFVEFHQGSCQIAFSQEVDNFTPFNLAISWKSRLRFRSGVQIWGLKKVSVLCGWWTPSALVFLLWPCENKCVRISPSSRAAVGRQVREIKHCTVQPKDLFSKLFFGDASVQRVLLPGQGVFSAAASSSSVLSCFYFRKALLMRSPALLSTARGPLCVIGHL